VARFVAVAQELGALEETLGGAGGLATVVLGLDCVAAAVLRLEVFDYEGVGVAGHDAARVLLWHVVVEEPFYLLGKEQSVLFKR